MSAGPRAADLRRSAAALLRLADTWEAASMPGDKGLASDAEGTPPVLLTVMIEQQLKESKQRRSLLGVGAFSDEALSLLLLALASPDKAVTVDGEAMVMTTGLPVSVCLRLLGQIAQSGAIELRHQSVKPPIVWYGLRRQTEADLALFLADIMLDRWHPT